MCVSVLGGGWGPVLVVETFSSSSRCNYLRGGRVSRVSTDQGGWLETVHFAQAESFSGPIEGCPGEGGVATYLAGK